MDVEGEVAVTLQNMKEHFTWQSPLGFLRLFLLACKILTQEGEKQTGFFTLMYKTLCSFKLLKLLEGSLHWTRGSPQVLFHTSSVEVPVEPGNRLLAQSSFLLEL